MKRALCTTLLCLAATIPCAAAAPADEIARWKARAGGMPKLAKAAGPLSPVPMVVEFHHPAFDHYFITSYPGEADSLAGGHLPPWVATGRTFRVWGGPAPGIANVCRFFSTTFAPRSSHFYSHAAAECPGLAAGGVWALEAADAFYMMPTPTGACPAGTVPLYRLYNRGMGGAPNHRYTTVPAVRAQMLGEGWIPEGNGVDGVFACVAGGEETPFQREVTRHADVTIAALTGELVDRSQLLDIFAVAINAAASPAATCPRVTTNPDLATAPALPANFTIQAVFGTACPVRSATIDGNVAGTLLIEATGLLMTDTRLSGAMTFEFRGMTVNDARFADGIIQTSMNFVLNPSTQALTGDENTRYVDFQGPNLGVNGRVDHRVNTAGTSTVAVDATFDPGDIAMRLSFAAYVQPDGSVVVDTAAPGSVGPYTFRVADLVANPLLCPGGATFGTMTFETGGRTATLTFDARCGYVYSGP